MTTRRVYLASALAAMMLSGSVVAPVQAAAPQDPIAVLSTYIGEWSGSGVLEGGKEPEPFKCRLSIDKGNQAKINYAGRCTLVNMNLSVSGTIAFDTATKTYQAVMSSNAGFTGVAVGKQQGGNITFDLQEKQTDRSGNAVRIGSHITLMAQTSITIDFQVEFNNSGNVLTATVPFSK